MSGVVDVAGVCGDVHKPKFTRSTTSEGCAIKKDGVTSGIHENLAQMRYGIL